MKNKTVNHQPKKEKKMVNSINVAIQCICDQQNHFKSFQGSHDKYLLQVLGALLRRKISHYYDLFL